MVIIMVERLHNVFLGGKKGHNALSPGGGFGSGSGGNIDGNTIPRHDTVTKTLLTLRYPTRHNEPHFPTKYTLSGHSLIHVTGRTVDRDLAEDKSMRFEGGSIH